MYSELRVPPFVVVMVMVVVVEMLVFTQVRLRFKSERIVVRTNTGTYFRDTNDKDIGVSALLLAFPSCLTTLLFSLSSSNLLFGFLILRCRGCSWGRGRRYRSF